MRTTLKDDFKTYVLNSGNMLNKLLALNIAVFLFFGIIYIIDKLFLINLNLEDTIKRGYLGFPAAPLQFLHRPWTIITYQFEHDGPFHLLFNMMIFFVAGGIFREFLGDKKLLAVYILGGAAGALMFMLAMNVFPLFKDVNPNVIGASASVIAVLAAAATLVPEYTINLVFFGPVRLIYVMLFFFVIDILSLAGGNGGGHFSHLGGAIFGFVYIKTLQNGTDIGAWFTRIVAWIENQFQPKKKNIRVSYRNSSPAKPAKNKISQEDIDAILDKIAKSGYDSLNQAEKDILFRASKDN